MMGFKQLDSGTGGGANLRSLVGGSITSLDGSSAQGMRAMENLRLAGLGGGGNMRSLERGFSMDQMRLENLHMGGGGGGGNGMRAMESNPNLKGMEHIRGGGDMNNGARDGGFNKQPGMVEHHMRSLDRSLPLELQYSRHHHHHGHRAQQEAAAAAAAAQAAAEFREHLRQQLIAGGAGGVAVQMANVTGGGDRREAGLSREDLRIRRRSSHDENQIAQGINGNDDLS